MELAQLKQVSLANLQSFLSEDHTSFSVLNVMLKSILSTGRTTVTLSKNSAKSFYLKEPKSAEPKPNSGPPILKTDCLKDAQNCDFFRFFNRKEKRLYIRFLDKTEANFEGTEANQPLLFLTLTFNTTQDNLHTFTTNWNPADPCWNLLDKKLPWLKDWATNFDPSAESLKILLKKIPKEKASNFTTASKYLSKFLRSIRLKWKPQNWKWVVVAELQKQGVWHFHLLSTPIVPYSHKCTLNKDFKSCWNCRTYLSELWPYGRVESRSPGYKTISKYLAKYLAKSFHLRSLYQKHGFQPHNKAYRFFKNIYTYEERVAIIQGKSKIDQETNQYLNGNQHIFRKADNTHFYRTNEQLVAKVQSPFHLTKNYRLGIRNLVTQEILQLAKYDPKKSVIIFQKKLLNKQPIDHDFQIFLITNLFLMAKKAEFVNLPLEKPKVPKTGDKCDQEIITHFQTKPVMHFTFAKESANLVRNFINNLDNYAEDYGLAESKDFLDSRFPDPLESRNSYLNLWQVNISEFQTERRTPM